MKKVFFTLLAVAAISSCSNEMEVSTTPVASDKLITFEAPIVAPTTRGDYVVDKDEKFPTNWKIKVWAKWHNGDYGNNWATNDDNNKPYMAGVVCHHQNTTDSKDYADPPVSQTGWYPQNAYYWPKNGKLTFQAVSQDNGNNGDDWATVATDGTGVTAAEYTFKNAGEQYDLMYSVIATNKTPGYQTTTPANTDWDLNPAVDRSYEGVQLMFRHACSNILFKAGTEMNYPNVTITLNEIILKGMDNKGTFAQNYAEDTQFDAPAWTSTMGAAAKYNYSNVLDGSHTAAYNGGAPAAVTQRDLIVMPQALTDGGQSLFVSYTITPDGGAAITQTFTQDLYDLNYTGSGKAFEPGKQYTFNIIFSLDQIYFSPEVTNWADVTVQNFNQDGPVAP